MVSSPAAAKPEKPYEAAVLRGAAAIDDLDHTHARFAKPMRRTSAIEGNKKGAEVIGNALLGGGAARLRLRLRAHMGTFGAIGLIIGGQCGEQRPMAHVQICPQTPQRAKIGKKQAKISQKQARTGPPAPAK